MKRVFVGYAAICRQTSRANYGVQGNPTTKAYACAQAATLIMNNQAFNFAKNDGRKWLAVSNLVQLYSHDATVLGIEPSMALIRASIWLIRRHRKSSNVTSSKISLPGSSPSGPRCGRDVIRHDDCNGNECDRAHHKLKERIPCSGRRASLLMGDTSRVLRWPYRNGLHWRPVVYWRQSAKTALRAEEAREAQN